MGYISFRAYLAIGVVVGAIVFGIGMLFGDDIVRWAATQDRKATQAGLSFIGLVVMEPLSFVFDPEYKPIGAIVAGLAWPLTLFWPVLIVFHFLAVEGYSFISEQEMP